MTITLLNTVHIVRFSTFNQYISYQADTSMEGDEKYSLPNKQAGVAVMLQTYSGYA
jgi:hypothetical protein